MVYPLNDYNILLGITGSIAAFKAASLARLLGRAGADVRVVMTANAQKLVTAETFCALTDNPVYTELFTAHQQHSLEHIRLAEWADLLIVAPGDFATITSMPRNFKMLRKREGDASSHCSRPWQDHSFPGVAFR